MLFSELYKIKVDNVTLVGLRGAIAPISPQDPPLGTYLQESLCS